MIGKDFGQLRNQVRLFGRRVCLGPSNKRLAPTQATYLYGKAVIVC
jgi:hypothetical protein